MILIGSHHVFSQKVSDVVGAYSNKGGAYYVKPNGEFVLIGYATFITGKWNIKEKGLIEFIPYYDKNKFVLYGRHTKPNNDSTKIMLSYGFYDEETFLQFGALSGGQPKMKRIFKRGHRHISFPYVYEVSGNKDIINFAYYPENTYGDKESQPEIYTFNNSEKYNDFIGVFNKKRRDYDPFYWSYKNGNLYQEENKPLERVDLEKALTESEQDLRELIESNFEKDDDKIFLTPRYKPFNENKDVLMKTHKFDKNINAWIDPLNYKKGEESNDEEDYNNINVIFEYKKLKDFSVKKTNITIDQVPIFKSDNPND